MAYTTEIRQKAIAYWEQCNNIDLVIQAYGISRTTLYSWKQLKKETGTLTPAPLKRQARKIDREQLKIYVEKNPDAYLFEIAEHFNCTSAGIFYALKAIGITHKKRGQPTKNKTP